MEEIKSEKMIAASRERSEQKMQIAKREIEDMLARKERVSVAALVKYTGLSEGFFYKNPEIRRAVDDAMLQQGAVYNPKKVIIDKAMEEKIINLKMTVNTLKKTMKGLEKENRELKAENDLLKTMLKEK